MPDGLAPSDILAAFALVPGPVRLPKPDIPEDPAGIPAPPVMPCARDDGPPAMLPMPDDGPWDPGMLPMPDIPDRTPSPATPRGRVAGALDIPLVPAMESMFGRVAGPCVPIAGGFAGRGAPVDRSPMPPIPPCCAPAGMATTIRARLNRMVFVHS